MINDSKNENVNVSVGFRVCSRYCDLKSTWGVVVYSRIIGIVLLVPNFYDFNSYLTFFILNKRGIYCPTNILDKRDDCERTSSIMFFF
jgi:hypothetical protein